MNTTVKIKWNDAELVLSGDYYQAENNFGDGPDASATFEINTVHFNGVDLMLVFGDDDFKRMELLAIAAQEEADGEREMEAAIDAYEALRTAA